MKSPLIVDAPSGFLSVWPRNLGGEQSHQSLFSLLLEIETQLRAQARRDSRLLASHRKHDKRKSFRRPKVENLSRYIE